MAYRNKPAEHPFKKLAREIKSGEIPSVLALCGREQYLVDRSIRMIVKKFVNPATKLLDYVTFQGDAVTLAELTEACETLSMFSEKRVVAVRGFAPLAGERTKNFSESDTEALCEYVAKLPREVCLILTYDAPDKKRKLWKRCEKAGAAYDFDALSEPELVNFIRKQFLAAGKNCRETVISELIDSTGYFNKETDYTLYSLENDLKKIISYSDGDEVTANDVLSVVSGSLETYIFALIDSIGSGNRGAALRLLHNILGNGVKVQKVLGMIVSQYEFILEVRELRETGMSRPEIVKTLDAHEFRVKKALGFAERCTTESLRRMLIAAYDADRNIKNGLLEQTLALELLIASA